MFWGDGTLYNPLLKISPYKTVGGFNLILKNHIFGVFLQTKNPPFLKHFFLWATMQVDLYRVKLNLAAWYWDHLFSKACAWLLQTNLFGNSGILAYGLFSKAGDWLILPFFKGVAPNVVKPFFKGW